MLHDYFFILEKIHPEITSNWNFVFIPDYAYGFIDRISYPEYQNDSFQFAIRRFGYLAFKTTLHKS